LLVHARGEILVHAATFFSKLAEKRVGTPGEKPGSRGCRYTLVSGKTWNNTTYAMHPKGSFGLLILQDIRYSL
jgi:hypothetical protein